MTGPSIKQGPHAKFWRSVYLIGVKLGQTAKDCGLVADAALAEYLKRFSLPVPKRPILDEPSGAMRACGMPLCHMGSVCGLKWCNQKTEAKT
jgi:hypothetical protein